jgi:hypothetical protein
MTTYEMRIWEEAIASALQGEYLKATTQEAEDVCNTIRGLIKGKIKITPEPEIVVEVRFPALLVPTPIKNAPLLYGSKAKANINKEQEGAQSPREERSTATATT